LHSCDILCIAVNIFISSFEFEREKREEKRREIERERERERERETERERENFHRSIVLGFRGLSLLLIIANIASQFSVTLGNEWGKMQYTCLEMHL
jgi:hypothetical protein